MFRDINHPVLKPHVPWRESSRAETPHVPWRHKSSRVMIIATSRYVIHVDIKSDKALLDAISHHIKDLPNVHEVSRPSHNNNNNKKWKGEWKNKKRTIISFQSEWERFGSTGNPPWDMTCFYYHCCLSYHIVCMCVSMIFVSLLYHTIRYDMMWFDLIWYNWLIFTFWGPSSRTSHRTTHSRRRCVQRFERAYRERSQVRVSYYTYEYVCYHVARRITGRSCNLEARFSCWAAVLIVLVRQGPLRER